jgi:hypothetical protein
MRRTVQVAHEACPMDDEETNKKGPIQKRNGPLFT